MTMEELSNVKGRGWDDVDVCLKADVVIRRIALNSDSNHSTRISVAILGKLGSKERMQLVQLKQLGIWAVGFFFRNPTCRERFSILAAVQAAYVDR